ncbi:MAG: hypothetical protein OJF51_004677 [Nitrospira sp.]|nr:MAG: hypothetical protein OJF51_004677 [Nitrospira sp.]
MSDVSFLQVPVPSPSRILAQSILDFDAETIECGRYVTSRSC